MRAKKRKKLTLRVKKVRCGTPRVFFNVVDCNTGKINQMSLPTTVFKKVFK